MTEPSTKPARRIIIIEDEIAFAQTLRKMLTTLGYEVVIAINADYSFELLDEDIIFLDVLMPDTSGLQVLDQLAHRGVKCPIVLMSGNLERLQAAERYAENLDLNLVGALEKPFRAIDVQEVLVGV